ncbi:MAG: replicative DNA helicase [Candidatus Margulisiibacteriota bacterium]|jgi:replicative DNA helicase
MEEKIPPQDLDAEQSVLGSLMISQDAVALVIPKIKPEYFYKSAHAAIYNAIVSLFQKNEPIDLVTLSNELKKSNELDVIGGRSYLAEILNTVPTAANIEHYMNIVIEKSILRSLIDAGTKIVNQAFDDSETAEGVMESAQQLIFDLTKEKSSDNFIHLKDILMSVIDDIHQVYDKENKIIGATSGFKDLDTLISGFQPANLLILAARPAMGKTALALNFALNAAILDNAAVAVFSLEMPKEQIALRLLSSESKIDSARIKTANMLDHEYKNLTQALGRLSEAPIYIEDTPELTPLDLKAKTRRLLSQVDLKLIIIDYLQLMKSGKRKVENRFQEVSEIVREIKAFSREFNIPVIALSQLSREVDKRTDTVPRLSDLRETGEIEQTADVVMFIHRPDYYDHSTETISLTSLYIEKHRHGPTGKVDLMFKKDISRFYSSEKA